MKKNFLLVCVLLFTGQSIYTQNNWRWFNPNSTNVTLRDGSPAGGSGTSFYCGDGGVVTRSEGYFGRPTPLNVPSNFHYTSIDFTNQNTGYLIGYNYQNYYFGMKRFTLFKTTDSGLSWTSQYKFNSNRYYKLNVVSPEKLFVVPHYLYSGNLLYSNNSGDTLIETNMNIKATSSKFINETTGYILDDYRIIRKTTNGGISSSVLYQNPSTSKLNDLDFYYDQIGFAVGTNGRVLRSTNGGASWLNISIALNIDLLSVKIVSPSILYISAEGGKIYRSSDAGVSWIPQQISNPNFAEFIGIIEKGPDIMSAYGYYGTVLRNYGHNFNDWELISSLFHIYFPCKEIQFISDSTAFVLFQNGTILKTGDAGFSFSSGNISSLNLDVRAMKFLNSTTGFVAGSNGFICRTTNTGLNWQVLSSNQNFWFIDMDVINDDIYASASGGNLRRSSNLGSTWHNVLNPATDQIYSVKFINENTGFIGEYKIYKTTDRGLTWAATNVPTGQNQIAFHNIEFVNGSLGFAAGEIVSGAGGRIFKTTDGGNNWNSVFSENSAVYKVKFINENTGYASAAAGYIYKTTNSGTTWQVEYATEVFSANEPNIWMQALGVSKNEAVIAGGTFGSLIVKESDGTVSVPGITEIIPSDFILYQNYPNPFNPVTKIKFSLPTSQFTVLKVFDITGREIAKLVSESLSAGEYEYRFDAGEFGLSSGVYFYRLSAGEFTQAKRFVLIK